MPTLAWMLAATASGFMPPALAAQTSKGLFVIAQDRSVKIDARDPIAFSPSGRYLIARGPQNKLALIDLGPSYGDWKTAEPKPVVKALIYDEFGGWDPTSRSLFVAGPDGVFRVDLGAISTPIKILPSGRFPSLSPDGTRLAFARPDGLWLANADGLSPRMVSKLIPTGVSWAPDGRKIGFVATEKGKRGIYVVSPNGSSLKRLGEAGVSSALDWAPDASRLLTPAKDGLRLVGVDGAPDVSLAAKAATWTRERRLLTSLDGKLHSAELSGSQAANTPIPLDLGPITALTAFRGILLEGPDADPFRSAPKPAPGEIRVRGIVEQVDVENGMLSLAITEVTIPGGPTRNYPKPLKQTLSASGRALSGIRVDSEVMAIGSGITLESATIAKVLTENARSSATAGGGLRMPRTNIEHDGVTMDVVTIPMVFPLLMKMDLTDSFLASRGGGSRRHMGQDLMAPKMTPLVATFDGTVSFRDVDRGNAGYMLDLTSDDGYRAVYIHLNNDTPGTDDGKGGVRFAFAPNLVSGDRVVAGQLLGWVGDSGNAEGTGPHCHFELHDQIAGGCFNAIHSLKDAERIEHPVYLPPAALIQPGEGEFRWDGVISGIDQARRVLTIELVATISKDKKPEVSLFPTRVYVRIPEGDIPLRTGGAKAKYEDLKVGQGFTWIGKPPKIGEAHSPAAVWFDLRG